MKFTTCRKSAEGLWRTHFPPVPHFQIFKDFNLTPNALYKIQHKTYQTKGFVGTERVKLSGMITFSVLFFFFQNNLDIIFTSNTKYYTDIFNLNSTRLIIC